MANRSASALYTPTLLALATSLVQFPLDKGFSKKAEGRSRTCGSAMEIGVDLDADGCVCRIGMQVTACAVGQSSAAILAAEAIGRPSNEFFDMKAAIEAWLNADNPDSAPLPDWPGLDALIPAREHKGRHGAIMLPWDTITRALSSEASSR